MLVDASRIVNWLLSYDEHFNEGCNLVNNLADLFPLPMFARFYSSLHTIDADLYKALG